MKKLLPLVLVFLGIVAFVFVIYQRRVRQQQTLETATIDYAGPVDVSLEPTAAPPAVFSFVLPSTSVLSGVPLEVPITLDTEDTTVYSTDIVLRWDPAVFQLSALVPGSYFQDVQVFRETYDQENGMAYYTLGSFTPGVGSDVIVTATFLPLVPATQSAISLSEESVVAGQGGVALKLNLPQQVVFSVD